MKAVSIALCLIALSSCKKENDVRYSVTCGSCDLTYSDSGENTQQHPMTGSWKLDFEGDPGQFLYVSAQNNNNSGTVSVEITVNGKEIDKATSSGAYVIATASGSVPD